MTIAKEDREFLELFRQATPEGKRLMVIELIALKDRKSTRLNSSHP